MAANSSNAAKMARFLAIIQIVTGVLLIGFGIADRLVITGGRYYYYYYHEWTGYAYFGIWIGIWVRKCSHFMMKIKILYLEARSQVNTLRLCCIDQQNVPN